jgi:D-glycero-D-manno-heptose 1,7-bisphosphate phosphatase
MTIKRPAVFIDRDGTVNEQMGYVNHPSRFIILPRTAVARGYFPIELLYNMHSSMKESLLKEGATVDGIFFCPHYPGGSVPEYSIDCDCRKPRTGLIKQACGQFEIDMSRSYMIGDHYSDMELAERADLRAILVKTGYGRGVAEYNLPGMAFRPCYIAEDLLDAVKWIIKK